MQNTYHHLEKSRPFQYQPIRKLKHYHINSLPYHHIITLSHHHINLSSYHHIMPLKKGKSKKVISANIKEIMHSYHKTGTIGTSTPASNDKAQKQAIAIAFDMAEKKK